MEHKVCNKCKNDMELTKFRQCKYSSGKLYYHSICKKCVSKSNVERVQKYGKKMTPIMKYLPYSIEQLKNHLKEQFVNSMSWQNYANYWQIDHIIPQSCLPYTSMSEENFKKYWSLNNLRPLEAKVNMSDGSTRIRHKLCLKELSNG